MAAEQRLQTSKGVDSIAHIRTYIFGISSATIGGSERRHPCDCRALTDYTELLNSVGPERGLPLPAGRSDQAPHPGEPDPREAVPITKGRDTYIPDLHIDTLNVKA